MRTRYFKVEYTYYDDVGRCPFALADPVGPQDDGYDREVQSTVTNGGRVEQWREPEYVLQRDETGRTLVDQGFTDFQPESRGLRLCSQRMRDVLDNVKAPVDELQWLPAWVVGVDGERRRYWVLHFPDVMQVAGYNPLTDPGGTMTPVVYLDRVGERQVFASPDGSPWHFAVTERVRVALESTGCRELEYTEIRQVNEHSPPHLPRPGTKPDWSAPGGVRLPSDMDFTDGTPR